jgi:hypothetical protein
MPRISRQDVESMGVERRDTLFYRHANVRGRARVLSQLAHEPFPKDSREKALMAIQLNVLTSSAEYGAH